MNLYSKNIFDKLSRNTRHTKYSTELVDITSGKGRIPKKLSTKIMKTVLSMVGGVAAFH